MLLSHRYKFIYLKTTKTAGTSVEMALEPFALPEGFDRAALPESGPIETEAGIVAARGAGARDHTWFGHMPAQDVRDQLGPEIWESYYKFCNIRNPWDKTVSWFFFTYPEMRDRPLEEVVAAFRATLRETTRVMRDFHIYAIRGTPVMDGYVRHAHLAEDLAAICARLDLPVPDLPTLKADTRGHRDVPYQTFYDAETRDRIATVYAPEIAHFGWSFED